MKTYIAFSDFDRAYICEAHSKKQMKAAGMNMRLDWREIENFDKAKREILCRGMEITNATNITNFKY